MNLMKALCGMSVGVGLLTGVAAGAAAPATFPAGTTMQRLAEARAVRIGVKFDQPLFGQRDLSGKPIGMDVELGKLIAAKMGIAEKNIEWVETTSANREPFLQQNKVDMVIATYAVTEKRREVVSFAGPYVVTGQDLLVKKGNPQKITGPQSMDGKKLCVINGSEGRQVITREYPNIQQVGFDAFSKCVEAVKNGSVDAATLGGFVILGWVSKEPALLESVNKPFTVEPWSVGITKGDKPFCEFIQGVLTASAADGSYQKIYASTVGKYDGQANPVLPKFDTCQ
jgi:glutamate transport system substrate-binding protein